MAPGLGVLIVLTLLGLFLSLAHWADRNVALRPLVLGGLALLDLGLMLVGAAYTAALFVGTYLGASTAGVSGVPGLSDPQAFVERMALTGPVLLTCGGIGMLLLFPPFRRPLARWIPIDPDRTAHVAAVHYAMILVVTAAVIAVVAESLLQDAEAANEIGEAAAEGGLWLPPLQNLGFVVLSFLGVGLLVTRGWREAAERLGLTAYVNVKWMLAVTSLGLLAGWSVDWLWTRLSPESLENVERLSETLFEPYLAAGVLGALVVGVSAGVGEEILFRGAMQPRFGLTVTALLFMALHTQYTISLALVQIFVLGWLLGLTRLRTNTTTAIAAHALYDIVLIAIAVLLPESSS